MSIKQLIISFTFFPQLVCISLFAQNQTEKDSMVLEIPLQEVITQDDIDSDDEVFTFVEKMPEFPGGDDGLYKFLGDNIQYPAEAKEQGIEGIVYVTFVIKANGKVTDVEVLRGIGGGCDKEAKRVIKKMPNWTPGTQRGRNVNVQFNLPLRFQLSGDKE
ncbi:MAG: hypothetical protein CL840_06275 [Crocinitomicaceae bacterium]|nr:hypothetical protein [Crocinitomicaceae bacterium]|tara:strand:+ start:15507 stop:15986 length:480 start_codon:yes stop_codon:yes gene_type:complete